jgi:hypothetical protein
MTHEQGEGQQTVSSARIPERPAVPPPPPPAAGGGHVNRFELQIVATLDVVPADQTTIDEEVP